MQKGQFTNRKQMPGAIIVRERWGAEATGDFVTNKMLRKASDGMRALMGVRGRAFRADYEGHTFFDQKTLISVKMAEPMQEPTCRLPPATVAYLATVDCSLLSILTF